MREREEYLNLLAYFMKLGKKSEDSKNEKLELKKILEERLLKILESKNRSETIKDVKYMLSNYDELFEEAYSRYLNRKEKQKVQQDIEEISKKFSQLSKELLGKKGKEEQNNGEMVKKVERLDFIKKIEVPDYIPIYHGKMVLKDEKGKKGKEEKEIS